MPAAAERRPGTPALPVVAIVGRPNVGKSTLFNRLVRARRAIVDDAPGVTRDRVAAAASHEGRAFLCVDTGGFAAEPPRDGTALAARVREQTLAAVGGADCVVCVFDGAAGLAPEDRDTVGLLRRSGKRVLYVVNKIDTAGREPLLHEFYAAGVDRLLPVSAAHGRGIDALLDAVVAALPEGAPGAEERPGTRLALIGRPNVGKSSLLNRLLGEDRAIVAPEPGTTRDAIDTPVVVSGRRYLLIDTAGIRRQGKVREPLERHGAVRALGTLARTDLVLAVLDAAEGMTDQDARLVGRAWAAGRGVILLANKWDTVPPARRDARAFRETLTGAHPAFARLPLLCVSALTGEGLGDLFPAIARVEGAYEAALPTPAVNRALEEAVGSHPPPSPGGRALRFRYATQTGRCPPAVTIFSNAPEAVPTSYARYLTGRLAEAFHLVGVPLQLHFRGREGRRPRPTRPRPPQRRNSPGRRRSAAGR
ncbi:MAG TPA: ribosome biogenesis GTPase Der [Candidatus Binatus sp.]|nr:ribosome biogenesis GTPase Der [Candidatus Binatus sp.]